MNAAWQYQKDLYYLNFTDGQFRNEIVVSKFKWWIKRIQPWRWCKVKNYNVLMETG